MLFQSRVKKSAESTTFQRSSWCQGTTLFAALARDIHQRARHARIMLETLSVPFMNVALQAVGSSTPHVARRTCGDLGRSARAHDAGQTGVVQRAHRRHGHQGSAVPPRIVRTTGTVLNSADGVFRKVPHVKVIHWCTREDLRASRAHRLRQHVRHARGTRGDSDTLFWHEKTSASFQIASSLCYR